MNATRSGQRYALEPHLAAIASASASASADQQPDDGSPRLAYLLIDQAQAWPPGHSVRGRAAWLKGLSQHAHQWIFENTFAHAAVELSPVLICLGYCVDEPWPLIPPLERAVSHLPLTSLLVSDQPLHAIAQHLQQIMRLDADGETMLWRLADTQMLRAVLNVMTPAQIQKVLAPLNHWWVADHHGERTDLAVQQAPTPAVAQGAMSLNSAQTLAMLDEIAPMTLAAQLRQFEPDFAQQAHAKQIQFAEQARALAPLEGVDLDNELLPWSLQRWFEESAATHATSMQQQ